MAKSVSIPLPIMTETFANSPDCDTVYIGENTSLSFLDYLRHSLRPWVGATSFTESERGNALLEPDIDEVAGKEVHLDLAEKRELFQSYCEVVRVELYRCHPTPRSRTDLLILVKWYFASF